MLTPGIKSIGALYSRGFDIQLDSLAGIIETAGFLAKEYSNLSGENAIAGNPQRYFTGSAVMIRNDKQELFEVQTRQQGEKSDNYHIHIRSPKGMNARELYNRLEQLARENA
jgi:hypothetical protein